MTEDYNNDEASDSMEGTKELLDMIFDSMCFILPTEYDCTDRAYDDFLNQFKNAMSN